VLDGLIVFGVVFGVNLLPAFGPPTWSVLVVLRLTRDIPEVELVLVGAVAAALGRYCLARGARALRGRLSPKRLESLEALRSAVEDNRAGAFAGLALFALSPIPSAQLFIAAGVTGTRLVPLTAAFFSGRLVSYSIYVGAASAASDTLGPTLLETLRSPAGIAVQVAMLAALVGLLRIDWEKALRRRRGPAPSRTARG
jgi:uncharacterized membrane protein YdjX (TVP38/TMEM64 family)